METYKVLMVGGVGLFIIMAILLRNGTTSMAMFITWLILAFVGLGVAAAGEKMRDRR